MTHERLGLSARHLTVRLMPRCDARLDSVDLYQVHAFDPLTRWKRRCARSTASSGPARSLLRLSNFTGWQLTKAVWLARAMNVAERDAPAAVQPAAREIEWEIVPAALDAGLGLLPWSPLGGAGCPASTSGTSADRQPAR